MPWQKISVLSDFFFFNLSLMFLYPRYPISVSLCSWPGSWKWWHLLISCLDILISGVAARQALLPVIKGNQCLSRIPCVTHRRWIAGQLASRPGNAEGRTHFFRVLGGEEKSHFRTHGAAEGSHNQKRLTLVRAVQRGAALRAEQIIHAANTPSFLHGETHSNSSMD